MSRITIKDIHNPTNCRIFFEAFNSELVIELYEDSQAPLEITISDADALRLGEALVKRFSHKNPSSFTGEF
jgi:hypothetical protein